MDSSIKQTPNITATKRCDYIDYAKAITIILMVLLHTTTRYGSLTNIIGSFHMAVFFIIGGVFFKPNTKLAIILKKSIKQLIIPYLCFSITALFICWISPTLHPEIYNGLDSIPKILKAAVIGIFIAQDNVTNFSFMPLGPLWFLIALFWCRLIFYFWIKQPKIYYIIISRILIIASLALILYLKPIFWQLTSVAVSFPFFLLGYYGRDYIINLPTKSITLKLLTIVVCSFMLIYFVDSIIYGGGSINGNWLVAYLRGIAGSLCLLVLCSFLDFNKKLSSILSLIGISTITILGLHFHLLYPIKVIYKLLFHGNPQDIHIMFALIASLIIVLILTYIHGYIIKKMPFIVGR